MGIDIEKALATMSKFVEEHENLKKEILDNPDMPQVIKDNIIAVEEEFKLKEIEYQKRIADAKAAGKKLKGYDPDTFEAIYE